MCTKRIHVRDMSLFWKRSHKENHFAAGETHFKVTFYCFDPANWSSLWFRDWKYYLTMTTFFFLLGKIHCVTKQKCRPVCMIILKVNLTVSMVQADFVVFYNVSDVFTIGNCKLVGTISGKMVMAIAWLPLDILKKFGLTLYQLN